MVINSRKEIIPSGFFNKHLKKMGLQGDWRPG